MMVCSQSYSWEVANIAFSVLVDALIMGLDDGQDILTLSIGGTNGWTEGTASVVASRIAALGKVVTIAAGNDVCTYEVWGHVHVFIGVTGRLWLLVHLRSGQRDQRDFFGESGQVRRSQNVW